MIRIKAIVLFTLFLFQFQTIANEKRLTLLTKKPQQGSMIIAKLNGEGNVYFNDVLLDKTSQGIFVFGVARDANDEVIVTIRTEDKAENVPIPIGSREWEIERVDGLPPNKISPKSKSVLDRIAQEGRLIRAARNTKSQLTHFSMPFIQPAQGRISGVYGSQRILNGVPKRPHFGLDIANKTGTPVIAPASGVVTLTHSDMFYSGATLVIDHGFGISSTYIHLSSIDVEVGQKVKQGDLIAKIGSTGRATGPHLDWRLNWLQTRLDPNLLLITK